MNPRRPVRRLAAAFALGCALLPFRMASAGEPAVPNWVLERFADDVAILRTTIPLPRGSARANLTLSCEGPEQRLRLTLPAPAARELGGAGNGTLLCRGAGAGPGDAFVLAGFGRPNPAVFTLGGDGRDASGGTVVALARILARQSGGLDCLVHGGGRIVSLRDVLALHLPLPTSSQDGPAVDEFVEACIRAAPGGAERRRSRTSPQPPRR